MSEPDSILNWGFLGRVPYEDALELQEATRAGVLASEREEHLFLLEHSHVLTLGRNADPSDIRCSEKWLEEHGVEIRETSRGGQVTYHGPGQLVGYPIIDLNPDRRDIRRYVRDLQSVLINTLCDFGIDAEAREAPEIGVWTSGRKIASIGVHLRRWVTLHGFALNVSTELEFFDTIVPCGLSGVSMTSMAREVGENVALDTVAKHAAVHFGEVFGRKMVESEVVRASA